MFDSAEHERYMYIWIWSSLPQKPATIVNECNMMQSLCAYKYTPLCKLWVPFIFYFASDSRSCPQQTKQTRMLQWFDIVTTCHTVYRHINYDFWMLDQAMFSMWYSVYTPIYRGCILIGVQLSHDIVHHIILVQLLFPAKWNNRRAWLAWPFFTRKKKQPQ